MRPQIRDELTDVVEQAAQEHGSKTAAVNHAVEQALGDDVDGDSDDKVNSHLRPELKKAHRILWDASIDGTVNMDGALAVLAQKMQVSKEICKQMYVKPLKSEDMVRVGNSWTEIVLYVRDPDQTPTDDINDETTDPRSDIDDPDEVDGQLDEIESADLVRADGGRDLTDDEERP